MGIFAKKILGGYCLVCETDGVVAGICQNCGYRKSASSAVKTTSIIQAANASFIDRHHSHSSSHSLGESFKDRNPSNKDNSLSNKHDLQHHTTKPVQGTTAVHQVMQTPTTKASQQKVVQKSKAISQSTQPPKSKTVIRVFFLATLFVWYILVVQLFMSFRDPHGLVSKIGTDGIISLAVATFFVWVFSSGGTLRTFFVLMILPVTSIMLFAKPFAAPVHYEYNGVWHPFSPSSETHMYFLIPGCILGFFTILHYYGTLMRMVRWFGRKFS